MMLAILGAMEEEVTLLRAEMTVRDEAVHAGISVTQGEFAGTEITLAQCGIGKVNAAICTQMLVDRYAPEALIFSGVAGGLLPNMRVGDLIAASHLIQFDIDLTAFGRRHGELPDSDRMIQSDADMVRQSADCFDAVFEGEADAPNLMIGTVVSGARFVRDSETLRWLQREFSALAAEMEGGRSWLYLRAFGHSSCRHSRYLRRCRRDGGYRFQGKSPNGMPIQLPGTGRVCPPLGRSSLISLSGLRTPRSRPYRNSRP